MARGSMPTLYTQMRKELFGRTLDEQKLSAKHSSSSSTAPASRYADHDTSQWPATGREEAAALVEDSGAVQHWPICSRAHVTHAGEASVTWT